MTEKNFEELIEDMAVEYAEENQDLFIDYDEHDDLTDYNSLKYAFIDGFKAGMRFKEEELS